MLYGSDLKMKSKSSTTFKKNHNFEFEIMELMNQIDYGWITKEKQKCKTFEEFFSKDYLLQSPKEVIHNQIGICWDQVELERYYFKRNHIEVKTYFLVYYNDEDCPTHTFLTYEKNGMYYWFEHSWHRFQGIHEYHNEKDLFRDVRNKFAEFELHSSYNPQNLILYEYEKPKKHISISQFYQHCENGKKIDI